MEKRPRLCKIELVCGVYLDQGKRVFQAAYSVEDLPDEILARQFGPDAVMRVGYSTVKAMIPSLLTFARMAKCDYLEINCIKGHGSYKWLRVRK